MTCHTNEILASEISGVQFPMERAEKEDRDSSGGWQSREVAETPRETSRVALGVYLPSITMSAPCPRLREGQVLSTVTESRVGKKYVHQLCNVFVTARRTTRDQQAYFLQLSEKYSTRKEVSRNPHGKMSPL